MQVNGLYQGHFSATLASRVGWLRALICGRYEISAEKACIPLRDSVHSLFSTQVGMSRMVS